MMNDFTCGKCHETFIKGWSEEEAEKEFASAPWNILGNDRDWETDSASSQYL